MAGMFLLPGLAALLPAQAPVFDLKACVQYTLLHHPSRVIYQNEVKISRQKTLEFISPYLPQVNGSLTFDDNLKRQTSIIPAGTIGNPQDVKVQFGTQYNTNGMLQLDQALFDPTMMYADAGIKATNKVADLKVMKNDEDIVYSTAIAYYNVLTLGEQKKLLEQNRDKYSELLKMLQLQYDKGVIKKVDYDRVKVGYNNITSQLDVIGTNYQVALNSLKNAMGMEMTDALGLVDSVNYRTDVKMPESNGLDVSRRFDYQLMSANIELQRIDMSRKKTAFIPTLSAYARYGGQALGNDFSTSFNNWFDYGTVGLKLNVPVFSGLRRHSQYMQSRFAWMNAKINLEMSEDNMQLQKQNAYTRLYSSYTNLGVNRENLALAREVFDVTSLQYQQGAATLSDFLNADYSYKEAQSNYIASLLSFLSARLDFEKAQGTLADYMNAL